MGEVSAGAEGSGSVTDVLCRLGLSSAFEPGNEVIGQLVEEFTAEGTVDILSANGAMPRGVAALSRRWREVDWLRTAEKELESVAARAIALVVPGTADWPTQLDDLADRAPLVLRVQGSVALRPIVSRSIAVVGARAATGYGVWAAEELCAQLAAEGWCVVSGGAMGIDAASHRGALAGRGTTIAVSAAGVDVAVPMSNDSLFTRIYGAGAVVSEVPIGSHPNRRRFLVRNRVIAALTPVTVVVEAALRSGALSTAREADAMGRRLCAFPGPTTSAMSAGCHELIRTGGAALVTGPEDVIEVALGHSNSMSDHLPGRRFVSIDLSEQLVLDACAQQSASVERIAAACELSVEAAIATLHLLERKALVRQTARGWRSA